MKNKKHFLFTKIDKETIKDTKVKRAIKLTLAFAFIFSLVMQLIGCISLSANAWDYNYYDEPQVSNSPTVEVVDELPTSPNANVIYIITNVHYDGLIKGTWVLNSSITTSTSLSTSDTFYVDFVIPGISTYNRLVIYNAELTVRGYQTNGQITTIANNGTVFSSFNTLVITSDSATLNGVDSTSLLYNWLEINAVKQDSSSTVTTTYNVYINSTWQTFDNLPQAVNSLFDGSFDSFIGSLLDSNGLLHQDIINWGDDKYERGYQQGLNDDYGKEVVLGFLSAPRDILSSFVLFEVGEVQISVWSVFTTILGVTLFIWFLKIFAGG